jgi:hypothetical protein
MIVAAHSLLVGVFAVGLSGTLRLSQTFPAYHLTLGLRKLNKHPL